MHTSKACAIGRAPGSLQRVAARPQQIRLGSQQSASRDAHFIGNARSRQVLDTRQQRSVVAQGLFGLGVPELVVIAGVAALIFGPSKLPELGKGLGKTVKSFQTAAKEFETELKQATSDDDSKAADGATKADKKE